MYNKNQYRKANDKKILHKKGKHWIVLSLFALAAGLGLSSVHLNAHAEAVQAGGQSIVKVPANLHEVRSNYTQSNTENKNNTTIQYRANSLHNKLVNHQLMVKANKPHTPTLANDKNNRSHINQPSGYSYNSNINGPKLTYSENNHFINVKKDTKTEAYTGNLWPGHSHLKLNFPYLSGKKRIYVGIDWTGFKTPGHTFQILMPPGFYSVKGMTSMKAPRSDATESIQVAPHTYPVRLDYVDRLHKDDVAGNILSIYNKKLDWQLVAQSVPNKQTRKYVGLITSLTVNKANVPNIPQGYKFAGIGNDMQSSDTISQNVSSPVTLDVYIQPQTYKETVDYQVSDNNLYPQHGQTIKTYNTTLNDQRATAEGHTSVSRSDLKNNLPKGYHLVSDNVPEHNAGQNYTDVIMIAPDHVNTKVSEHISYVDPDGNNRGSVSLSGTKDTSGVVDNSTPGVPQGWSAKRTTFTYDGNNVNVIVTPVRQTDTVQFVVNPSWANSNNYNGPTGVISTDKTDYQGNDSRSGAQNTQYYVQKSNPGMPDYYIPLANQVIPYDGKTHQIFIEPKLTQVKFNFFYNGKRVNPVSTTVQKFYNEKTQLSVSPSGWILDKIYNYTVPGSDTTENLNVRPESYPLYIYYVDKKNRGRRISNYNILGTDKATLNDQSDTVAGNTSMLIDAKHVPGLPVGYKFAGVGRNLKPAVNISHRAHPRGVAIIVYVESVNGSAILNYRYNGKTIASGSVSGDNGSKAVVGTQPNNLPAYYKVDNPNQSITYNGAKYNIAIVPQQATDTVNYQYNGKTLGSQTFSGNDDRASQANDTTFTVDSDTATKVPNHYHLTAKPTFSFDNKSYNVKISPDAAKKNVHYIYHRGHGVYNEGATVLNGLYGQQGNVKTTRGLNAGYHLANPDNPFTYNDSADLDVNVVPNAASADVQYTYDGHVITDDSSDFKGNDSQAIDADNTGVNITSDNDSKLPVGWRLANKSTNVPFDNQKHAVAIVPKRVSDVINYQYKNKTLGIHIFIGNDAHATAAGDNGFTVNNENDPGIPSDYRLVNPATFKYDNQTHVIQIVPKSITEHIQYMFNGHPEGSTKVNGPFDTESNWQKTEGLNAGWHLANSNNYFGFINNGTLDVAVSPNQATDTINYIDTANHKVGSQTFTGNVDQGTVTHDAGNTNFNVNARTAQLPNGYHLVNADNQFNYDDNSHNVSVALNPVPDKTGTITIKYSDASDSSHTFANAIHTLKGNSGSPFNDLAYYENNVPQGYQFQDAKENDRIINNNIMYNSDNPQTIVIDVTKIPAPKPQPSDGQITVKYRDGNQEIDSDVINGKINTPFNPSFYENNVPSGYSFVSAHANSMNFGNHPQTFTINVRKNAGPAPRPVQHSGTIIVNYYDKDNGQQVPHSTLTFNGSDGQSFAENIINDVPKGYQFSNIVNGHDINRFNDQTQMIDIDVTKIKTPSNNHQPVHPNQPKVINHTVYVPINHGGSTTNTVYVPKYINRKPAKLITVKNPNVIKVGQTAIYHGYRITRISQAKQNLYWFYVIKTCLAHNHMINIGTTKDYDRVFHPKNMVTIHINRIFVVHTHEGNRVRFEFRTNYRHGQRNYFVTGDSRFTRNAYVQPSELKRSRFFGCSHQRYFKIWIAHSCRLYRNKRYVKSAFIRNVRRGEVMHVRRLVKIGYDHQTRFQLTNGDYVTANRNFTQLIK